MGISAANATGNGAMRSNAMGNGALGSGALGNGAMGSGANPIACAFDPILCIGSNI
jgi:hypothetical protein